MSDWMLNYDLYKNVEKYKREHPGVLEAQTAKRKAEEKARKKEEARIRRLAEAECSRPILSGE